jgi:hypothetical protein
MHDHHVDVRAYAIVVVRAHAIVVNCTNTTRKGEDLYAAAQELQLH